MPCLAAVAQSDYPNLEVLIVDNASKDDSVRVASEILQEFTMKAQVIALPQNLGCAGGNNVGWLKASGEFIVFLNPDTEVEPSCFSRLVDLLQKDPQVGITGAKMFFPGKKILQHAGGIVHPNGMTNHYGAGEEDRGQHDTVRDVAYVTGAGFAIRRNLLEKLGGLDEDYFPAYYEEVDLCLRVRRAGLRVVYVPTAVLVHHESVSMGSNSSSLHRLFPQMRVRYLVKNLTLRQLAGWAAPFEYRWMRYEQAARGYRLKQIRGWIDNVPWLLKHFLGGRKRKLCSRDRTRGRSGDKSA